LVAVVDTIVARRTGWHGLIDGRDIGDTLGSVLRWNRRFVFDKQLHDEYIRIVVIFNYPEDQDKDDYEWERYERYCNGEGRPFQRTFLPDPESLIKRARSRDKVRRMQAHQARLDLFWRQVGVGLLVLIVVAITLVLVLAISKPT
jgi:hypothetical protein